MTTLDVASFPPAVFAGRESFDHFENPDHPRCFACNSRGMLVRPVAVTDDYVLLPATTRLAGDGGFVVIPRVWLLFPRSHVATPLEMPDDWERCKKEVVRLLGLGTSFNYSDNWGSEAGQTIGHAHTWIIERGQGTEGPLTRGTGLATILLNGAQ